MVYLTRPAADGGDPGRSRQPHCGGHGYDCGSNISICLLGLGSLYDSSSRFENKVSSLPGNSATGRFELPPNLVKIKMCDIPQHPELAVHRQMPPVAVTRVIGGVQTSYPGLCSLPAHFSIPGNVIGIRYNLEPSFIHQGKPVLSRVRKIGVTNPGDVAIRVVNDRASKTEAQED